MKDRHRVALVALIAISVVLHIVNIAYPSSPAFDEAHFATYASDYAAQRPYFDIHPPLGKLLYAVPLLLYPPGVRDATFISFGKDPAKEQEFKYTTTGRAFGLFPYIPLRLESGLFGILLILVTYLFLTYLTGERTVGLLGAFFVTFDNAFLVDTRFILMDGMYMALGLISLSLFFKKAPRPILSVKLTAVVFFGPLAGLAIYGLLTKRRDLPPLRDIKHFVVAGLCALAIAFLFVNNLVIPATDRVAYYRTLMDWKQSSSSAAIERIPFIYQLAASTA